MANRNILYEIVVPLWYHSFFHLFPAKEVVSCLWHFYMQNCNNNLQVYNESYGELQNKIDK